MCGRYVLGARPEDLQIHFGLAQPPTFTARYNTAPSQTVPVVAPKADRVRRGLAMLKWGLVPYWSNDGKPGPINARAETVGGLPTFADSFRSRRCIVPATGFYEWRVEGKKKYPQRFRLATGGVMGFAGTMERVGRRGRSAPGDLLRHHHGRERTGASVPRPDARGSSGRTVTRSDWTTTRT